MSNPVVVSHWFWNISLVVMSILGVIAVLLLGKIIWLLVIRAPLMTEQIDQPASGMERSTRDEYALPVPIEVIRFGPSTSNEDGFRHIAAMNRRLATQIEIKDFLVCNPDVEIDLSRDFVVVI